MTFISIPSAKRLISSMRDLGYEFSDAVAEIVDICANNGKEIISKQSSMFFFIFKFNFQLRYGLFKIIQPYLN